MKHCFVISPIGKEDSPIREHADDVFEYIIKPAMDQCGIVAMRADHLQEPGKITDQMYREIFQSDLCIAVLKGHNPNVFYELGVAQSAGKPIIILNEKSDELPFDLRDLRAVSYDLKPRNLFEKIFVTQIAAHVDSLAAAGWKVQNPFRDFGGGSPGDGDSPSRGLRFYAKHQEYGGTEKWLGVIREASKRIDLLSTTMDSWRDRRGFRELILEKARSGCQVRLLMMHPDNPVLGHITKSSVGDGGLSLRRAEIELMGKYYAGLVAEEPRIGFRQIRTGSLHLRLVIADHKLIMSPYLFSEEQCPLLESTEDATLYSALSHEFECLWDFNAAK